MLTIDTVYRFIKLHPIEITLISLASIITIISLVLHVIQQTNAPEVLSTQTTTQEQFQQSNNRAIPTGIQHIFVEVSGAVVVPDVYEVPPGTRLKDVIEMSGGLSTNADSRYVARNYNLSKFVGDQEKIYIPYTWDIINGTFVEQKRILEYLQPLYSTNLQYTSTQNQTASSTNLTISINTSSAEELDTLPGIGPVTAQKIMDNRPYALIDELLSKKVMSQSTFEKIKENITP